jgi:hypothetical protein
MRKLARWHKVLLGIASVWLVGMAAMAPSFLRAQKETKSATDVVQRFAQALKNRDYQGAYAFCGDEFHNSTPFERFQQTFEGFNEIWSPFTSVKSASYEVHGRGTPERWSADYAVELVYAKRTVRLAIALRQQGGHWVIFGMEEI